MKKILFTILAVTFALGSTAIAQRLPSYYPAQGFQDSGVVDAVYLDEGRIVIDDVSYALSDSAQVHSLSSINDSMARVARGVHVGFKLIGSNTISEFWLLPSNYDGS